ncbi:MAG: hypothetical protein A4E65_02571 [Syntrophorhabdus sp. PtaU1.Bin153]|nr:MAG: hypothetical protein A4E65_02571 [Syntrophorhabdus sp. PtaU1.Bin153]
MPAVDLAVEQDMTIDRMKDHELHCGLRVFSSPLLIVFLIGFLAFFLADGAHALDVPPLKGYVNDYANMISRQTQSRLEAELKAFERTDSTQLVILTVPSLDGETIEGFSIKVAEAWKIGQKGRDNGIIFLVAAREKRIRIEVGRGLEGRLTDLTAGRIIDLVVKPRFKRGDFNGGFVAGTSALIDATKGEFKAEEARPARKGRSFSPMLTLLLFAGIGLLFLGSFSRVAGGIAGAIGLPGIAFLTLGPSMITLVLLGLLGLAMGILLPFLFSGTGHGRGGGMFFPGGGFFGTGGGGDFNSGGGFGGGGGDFGGGGASGDW